MGYCGLVAGSANRLMLANHRSVRSKRCWVTPQQQGRCTAEYRNGDEQPDGIAEASGCGLRELYTQGWRNMRGAAGSGLGALDGMPND